MMQSGDTPLHVAAEGGFLDVVSLLIAAGASAWVKNKSGKRPRDIASRFGHVEMVDMLDAQTRTRESEI